MRRQGDGTIDHVYKGGDYHRHTVEWPVKTMRDWQAYKRKHLDPDAPSGFPDDWGARVKEYRQRDYPLQLTHRGVYGFARERMGDENLAYAFYDALDLVHDMMESYTDMASKNGSLISPRMFDEFMAPCYRRIAAFAREHGIEVILVDSDGFVLGLATFAHYRYFMESLKDVVMTTKPEV